MAAAATNTSKKKHLLQGAMLSSKICSGMVKGSKMIKLRNAWIVTQDTRTHFTGIVATMEGTNNFGRKAGKMIRAKGLTILSSGATWEGEGGESV